MNRREVSAASIFHRDLNFARQPESCSAILLTLTLLFYCHDASAYIDPNAGGLLMQILLPLWIAILAVFATCKDWVLSVLARIFKSKNKEKNAEDA